jgi:hypothetical protein
VSLPFSLGLILPPKYFDAVERSRKQALVAVHHGPLDADPRKTVEADARAPAVPSGTRQTHPNDYKAPQPHCDQLVMQIAEIILLKPQSGGISLAPPGCVSGGLLDFREVRRSLAGGERKIDSKTGS